MINPTINNNGTAADDLFNDLMDAHRAVREALAKVCRCGPHGRDYQTNKSNDAYLEARATWEDMHDKLVCVRNELYETAERVYDQMTEKQKLG